MLIAGGQINEWWRKEGHLLQSPDLDKIWKHSPQLLIIGRGASGVMKVSPEVERICREKGIRLKELKTGEAVKEFNSVSEDKNVACGLHLTC